MRACGTTSRVTTAPMPIIAHGPMSIPGPSTAGPPVLGCVSTMVMSWPAGVCSAGGAPDAPRPERALRRPLTREPPRPVGCPADASCLRLGALVARPDPLSGKDGRKTDDSYAHWEPVGEMVGGVS